MSHDPIKPLFEDASAPSELRDFVTMARNDGASQAELDRLAMRMAPVVGVSAAFIASSAAAIGTAPVTAVSAFGAGSGLTPALGAASAAKVSAAGGAASTAKAGLLGKILSSASAKVLAVSLGVGAAGAAVYSATSSKHPSPELQAAAVSAGARSHAVPAARGPSAGEVLPAPGETAAPAEPALEVADEVASPAISSARPASARAPLGARKQLASAARALPAPVAQPAPEPVASAEQPITDQPVEAQAAAENVKPSQPPPSELSLIERAEASRTRPNEALAFLAKHEEVYPRGALAQEREVLAVELLLKAGKLREAEARAERFEDVYPRSAHLPHLRALLTRASAK
jgi:hypothetical protein